MRIQVANTLKSRCYIRATNALVAIAHTFLLCLMWLGAVSLPQKILYIRDIEETAASYEGALFLALIAQRFALFTGRQYDPVHDHNSCHGGLLKGARFTTGQSSYHSMGRRTLRVAMRVPQVTATVIHYRRGDCISRDIA